MRSMMRAREMPDSSRAVCPELGSITRRASGISRTRRPDSSSDGSKRSAALATIRVGALHITRVKLEPFPGHALLPGGTELGGSKNNSSQDKRHWYRSLASTLPDDCTTIKSITKVVLEAKA